MNDVSYHRSVSDGPRPAVRDAPGHGTGDGVSLPNVPPWLSRHAAASTLLVIVLIEGLRLYGTPVPVPFLMLLGSVVFAAALGGTRSGVFSGVTASVYFVFAGLYGIGAGAFGNASLELLAGVCVIMLVSLALGTLQDRNFRVWSDYEKRLLNRERSLVRDAPEAICTLDVATGRMVDGNPYAFRMFAMKPEEFRGAALADLCPDRQPDGKPSGEAAAEKIRMALETGVAHFEWWHLDRRGREFPCEVSLSRLQDPERLLVRGSLRDISTRKHEEALRQGEHDVLALIAAGAPLGETLETLALLVERVIHEGVCTVLVLDEDGRHVGHGASPSVSKRYREAIDGAEIGPEAGSCGTAMFLDRQVITEDIREDPNWDRWRAAAEEEGLRACWSTPVHGTSGKVTGSFALYFRHPRSPTVEELDILTRMRNLAGIAIERSRREQALRYRETLYRATFEQAAVGITHIAPDGRYIRANAKFCEMLGYTEEELQTMRFQDVTYPDDLGKDERHVELMLKGKQDTYYVEKRYRHKSGELLWVNLSASAVRRDDGTVDRFVVVVEDVSEARKLSEELSYQARHDALTGLINRNEFEARVHRFLGEVRSGEAGGAVCYLDLDQFKLVNDTAGHVAGDEMLRQLARELERHIRSSDVLGRLGGDEFGALLQGCDADSAREVADKMRRAVEDFTFSWGDKTFRLGVSIGVVPLENDLLPTVTEVLQAADAVCYTAKDAGRNRTVVWRPDDASIYRRHGEMQWVPRLGRALDDDLFVLLAQPIVPLNGTDGLAWYELLIRLRDGEGLVAPGAFLPAAERYGLAQRLDRFVTSKAVDWLAERPADASPVTLSVNLSGASIGEPVFQEFVTGILEGQADIARQLCFEITETAAISNLTEAAEVIEGMRGFGCHVALDDFGSGLSSFAYLKHLPVDYLKIDGTFVRDIASDPVDRAIVQSIHEVGRVMGKATVAEFVESEAIAEVLQEMGVDFAQGYWIGHPAPLDRLSPVEDPGTST